MRNVKTTRLWYFFKFYFSTNKIVCVSQKKVDLDAIFNLENIQTIFCILTMYISRNQWSSSLKISTMNHFPCLLHLIKTKLFLENTVTLGKNRKLQQFLNLYNSQLITLPVRYRAFHAYISKYTWTWISLDGHYYQVKIRIYYFVHIWRLLLEDYVWNYYFFFLQNKHKTGNIIY